MPRVPDIGEVFCLAWSALCEREYVCLGPQRITGMEIRRLVSSLAGSGIWKGLEGGATTDQLYLLGLDVARCFRRRGEAVDPTSLWNMADYEKAEITELGRIACNAIRGPTHKVLKALFRRFK